MAGKGGVGKTTTAATLALVASRCGLDVLLVEVEGRVGAERLLGYEEQLGYEERQVQARAAGRGAIRARWLRADEALLEYLGDRGLGPISRRLAQSGALDVVATAVPGIRDILVLGKVKQLERAGTADLIIVDGPAAGHSLSFLSSAAGLLDAARIGPIRTQAEDVVALLADPARCQVMLVTLAEETPVNETVATGYTLEDQLRVALAPVVVNCWYPTFDAEVPEVGEAAPGVPPELRDVLVHAATYRRRRHELQEAQLERLAEALALPRLFLPQLFGPARGLGPIGRLADAMAAGIAELAPA